MTEQPRLTDAARAAIEAAGTDPYNQVATLAAPTQEAGQSRVFSVSWNADYQRGWDDCYARVLKVLGDNFTTRTR